MNSPISSKVACLTLILLTFLGLLACSSMTPSTQATARLSEAQRAGFVLRQVEGGRLTLTTLYRGLGKSALLTVYIEGDGHAWKGPTRPSTDPTPHDPIGLELALKDPGTSVLYIARPCQFSGGSNRVGCNNKYWTTHRYSEEVVSATNQVIESVIAGHWDSVPDNARPRVSLVGYSGGGTLAALVAARRSDVLWLVTVAANLDHETWTKIHGLTPLAGSLNPIDFAGQLAHIPQLHLRGEHDSVVPITVLESFIDRLRLFGARVVNVQIIPTFGHGCCWDAIWPGPLDDFMDPQY